MRWRHKTVREVGRAVQGFFHDNKTALGRLHEHPECRVLNEAIREIERCFADQEELKVRMTSLTKLKHATRKDLLENHVRPIAAIARNNAKKEMVTSHMRLPRKRASAEEFAQHVHGMAKDAAKHPEVYRTARMPFTFLEELHALVDEFQQLVSTRANANTAHIAATAGVTMHTSTVRQSVKLLGTFVVKQLAGRPDLIAAWKQAKRYPKKRGVKRKYTRRAATKGAGNGPTEA